MLQSGTEGAVYFVVLPRSILFEASLNCADSASALLQDSELHVGNHRWSNPRCSEKKKNKNHKLSAL
jgi:hypothetical protein